MEGLDEYISDWVSRAEERRSLAVYAVFAPLALALLGVAVGCVLVREAFRTQIHRERT